MCLIRHSDWWLDPILGCWNHRDLRTGSGTIQLRPANGSVEHNERLRGEVESFRKDF